MALFRRDRIRLLLEPPTLPEASAPLQRALLEVLRTQGASFFAQLRAAVGPETSTEELLAALWELVWAGLVTNDTFQPLRALASPPPRAGALGRRAGHGERGWAGQAMGRWSTVGALVQGSGASPTPTGSLPLGVGPTLPGDTERVHARARMLLDRYGIVSREMAAAEGMRGGFSDLARVLRAMEDAGKVRRGFFVDGLGGAQFALPAAVERLRAARDLEPRPGSGPDRVCILAVVDPANPYGASLPWPAARSGAEGDRGLPAIDSSADASETGSGSARRSMGARVVLVRGVPVLFIERGGRQLRVFSEEDADIEAAVAGLRREPHRRGARARALRVERVNGGPALRSPLAEVLLRDGFRLEPGALVLDPAS